MASVDVVIPNYNYARFLGGAIDSALGQDGVDVRVLVVDNASTDESLGVVEAAMARDPRVHLLTHQDNQGLLSSLNDGVDWLAADYAVNLSADDRLTPGSLRRGAAVLDAHPDVTFVYGPVYVHKEGRLKPPPLPAVPLTRIWDGPAWLRQVAGAGHVCIRSPEVLARSALVKECGYDRSLPHTSDMGLCLRLGARGGVAHLRGVRQAVYTVHGRSLMRSITDPVVTDLFARRDAFEVLVEKDAALLEDPPALFARACEAIAAEAALLAAVAHDRGAPSGEITALLDAARAIWSPIVFAPHYRRASRPPPGPRWGPGRTAWRATRVAATAVRKARSRELGQWPSYVR